jgi:pentatricopeptide repeat protein
MPEKNVVSWTALIAGYAQNGHAEEALKLFCQMRQTNIKLNQLTFSSVISACGDHAAMEQGQQIHAHVMLNMGMVGKRFNYLNRCNK